MKTEVATRKSGSVRSRPSLRAGASRTTLNCGRMDEEFNPTSHTNYCQKLLHSFCGVLIGALSTPC